MPRLLKSSLILLLFVGSLAGCAPAQEVRPLITLLGYKNFGPQAMAYELIGMEWWQPDDSGQPAPARFKITVVVYQGLSLEEIKARYPVTRAQAIDYRYVTYDDAIAFLERHIEEDALPSITAVLRDTRNRLKIGFGDYEFKT